MGKAPSLEDRLAELADLGEQAASPEKRKALRKYLSSKISLVVAKAAQIVADSADAELASELIEAFQRCIVNPTKTDKGCFAKIAIMKALLALDWDREEIFLEGIRHFQPEPSYGGPIDTAVELRALGALGLVQIGSPEALTELATLLADKEPDARIGAVHALGQTGNACSAVLLRFKVLTGDREPRVVSECFNALMTLAPRRSLDLIGGFVDSRYPDLCEAAALALGESRLTESLELLKEKWSRTFDPQLKRILLLPIALARQEASIDFLLSVVARADIATATAAISALGIYSHDQKVREQVRTVIEDLERAELRTAFQREFK